ncbi:MAG TPA: BadF/BadG/BcrA/BcrD ATPase family protein [Solirubrobacteraceae bacterium]|jgi:glucosamine kinase|nr:BadF/BadG/BcrA/BcrD ATPase family protein [Solirubrobacteraceae bacterium]
MSQDPLVQLPDSLRHPVPAADARYLMAIDGGATKTLAAVLDLHSNVLHFAHGGPSNEDAVGVEAAVRALLDVADEAMARAGITEGELARAVLAVAGTDTAAIARNVGASRSEDWIVVNDVVGAWATATGGAPGVAAISGTGSNVFGVGPSGKGWRTGGWGHLLGDEGSGYWLGIESIKAALRERDGSGPETGLSGALVEFFAVQSVEALASLVYSKPLTKGEIAAFAAQASKVADAGDAAARAIYQRGARELAGQIAVVIARTGLGEVSAGDGFPVGLIGSAFKAGAVFVDPLVAGVRAAAPGARVSVVEMAPVGGGLLLAARACGATLGQDELARLLDTSLMAQS